MFNVAKKIDYALLSPGILQDIKTLTYEKYKPYSDHS